MPVIHDEDGSLDQTFDDMAGLHPPGQYQCVIAQIPKFRAVYKTHEGDIAEDDFFVFCLQTQDEDGNRRVIDTNKMTGKPYSGRSTMGILLKGMFGGAKPDELKQIVPSLKGLLGRNFIVSVQHEVGKQSGTVYAMIAQMSPIQMVPVGKDEKGKVKYEPAFASIEPDDSYENFYDRKARDGYTRIPDPANPAKQIWFKPLYEPKDDDNQEVPAYAGAQPEAAPPQTKAAAGASKAKSKF